MFDKLKQIALYYWGLAKPHLISKSFWVMVTSSVIHVVSKTFHLGLTDSHISGAATISASYIVTHIVHDAIFKKDGTSA